MLVACCQTSFSAVCCFNKVAHCFCLLPCETFQVPKGWPQQEGKTRKTFSGFWWWWKAMRWWWWGRWFWHDWSTFLKALGRNNKQAMRRKLLQIHLRWQVLAAKPQNLTIQIWLYQGRHWNLTRSFGCISWEWVLISQSPGLKELDSCLQETPFQSLALTGVPKVCETTSLYPPEGCGNKLVLYGLFPSDTMAESRNYPYALLPNGSLQGHLVPWLCLYVCCLGFFDWINSSVSKLGRFENWVWGTAISGSATPKTGAPS